jgi:hypothetical protein
MKSLCLIPLCLLTCAAFAATEVLQPGPADCCDSFIWQQNPDTNYDSIDHLEFGYSSGSVLSLLRFDELDDPRFDDCILGEAFLALRPKVGWGWGAPPIDCEIWVIIEDWDEETLTWNNRPDCDFPCVEFTYSSDSDWFSVDVTEIVREWLENGESNHGFCLRIVGGQGTCGAVAHSGEYSTNPAHRPKLTVEYTPDTAVVETSWGEIKALE